MPWINADDLLAYWERKNGPTLAHCPRPLNYTDAAALAEITGALRYEHQSDGTTKILVEEEEGDTAADRLMTKISALILEEPPGVVLSALAGCVGVALAVAYGESVANGHSARAWFDRELHYTVGTAVEADREDAPDA